MYFLTLAACLLQGARFHSMVTTTTPSASLSFGDPPLHLLRCTCGNPGALRKVVVDTLAEETDPLVSGLFLLRLASARGGTLFPTVVHCHRVVPRFDGLSLHPGGLLTLVPLCHLVPQSLHFCLAFEPLGEVLQVVGVQTVQLLSYGAVPGCVNIPQRILLRILEVC